jgi:2'-5' RNA ligase
MRLFVGIAITDEIREKIKDYQRELQQLSAAQDKWVKPESLHLTLKFIGESEQVSSIEAELVAVSAPPIAMTFRGVGFFTANKPRIFWAGVHAGPELESLATTIDERLHRVGIAREPHTYQEYQPHITLARVGSGRPQGSPRDRNKTTMKALQDLVAKQLAPDFGTMTADEFILFRSETLPGGSRYTPLKRFPLK